MRKIQYLFLGLFAVCVCSELFITNNAEAEELKETATMQVSPVIEELTLDPNTQVDKSISVTNQGDHNLKIRVYVAPYSFLSESSSSDFETQTEYTQIYHWIKIQDQNANYQEETEYNIAPHASATINYRVEVPASAPGGSQHACLFVETIPDETANQNGITTISRAAIKIFATVSGDTLKDAEVSNYHSSSVVIGGNISAKANVKNIGNVDIKPTLTLRVNALNGETVFNETTITAVFPEQDNEIKIDWPETPQFGIYNVKASLNALGENTLIEKTVFVFPVWFLILVIIILATIGIFISKSLIRRRNQRARKKSTTNNN